VIVSGRAAQRRILGELERRAKIDVRGRGRFDVEVAGIRHVVRVRMRNHFGESAFDLVLERAPARSPGAKRR
jgi:hypothetical protein